MATLEDELSLEKPWTSNATTNLNKIKQMIKADSRLSIRAIVVKLDVGIF